MKNKTKKIVIPVVSVLAAAAVAVGAYFPVSSAIRTNLNSQTLSSEFFKRYRAVRWIRTY